MQQTGNIGLLRIGKTEAFGEDFCGGSHPDGMKPEMYQFLMMRQPVAEAVKNGNRKNDASYCIEPQQRDSLGDGGYSVSRPDVGGIGIMENA